MIKKTKSIISMLLLTLALLFNFTATTKPVKADSITMGKVYIRANYSADITPQSGDKFIITYKKYNGKETATIELDASTISTVYTEMNLPINSYCITAISYAGNNNKIKEDGYGITVDFSAKANDEDIIYLAIGTDQTSILEREYANVIIMNSQHDANGKITDLVETESVSEQITTQVIETTTVEETVDQTVEQTQGNEEPSIEYYEEDEKNSGGIGGRLVPILIMFVIGIAVLFLLHKKGKL